MDRISQLPECIVHHILSFVKTVKELVRMSVLSKNWFDLTASFPILDFNLYNFKKVPRQRFFKYIEYATSRFCHQNVTTAQRFKIIATTLLQPTEFDIINRCLDLKNGVRQLIIFIANFSHRQKYRLPNILLSVSELKSLTISGCDLPSSLSVDVIRFKSLIQLRLDNVSIDDEAIKYLTTSCPLLQEFHISNCHGLKRFCVHGHQNLQKVRLYYYNTPLERIDIEAPNLSNLKVKDVGERGAPLMNLGLCKKLTTVTYNGHPLPNSNGFTDFLSNFPFIENLILNTNYKCKKLRFSSHSLKTLVLHSDCDLEDIELNAPNLVLFYHVYSDLLLWPTALEKLMPLSTDSTLMQSNPSFICYANILWLKKLRQFLDKKNGFKVFNLYITAIDNQKLTDLEKLKVNELPPYELEHVELQLDTRVKESLADHIAFVDAVLWCCRPRSLTLRSSISSTGFKDVVEFTHKKLLEQEDEGHTKIQIVGLFSPEAQKHSMDLESLLMALPLQETTTITFIKEQVG